MNITHFVENLNRGGLERVVIDLIKTQQAQGHHCQVICLFEPGSLAGELVAIDVPVENCGKRQGFDLRAIARARAALRKHATEVLHTHNAMAHYYGVFASLGLALKCRVNTRHSMGGQGRRLRRDWLYRRSLMVTDVVASVCEAASDDAVLQGLVPARKATAVPNGIPVARFEMVSVQAHRALAEALDVPVQTRIVGTVGRLHPAKDHVTLIRAFRRVLESHPESVLVVVGNGQLRAELEQCARAEGVSERVRLLGDRNDVNELLRGFDLFVMSSLTEGYSVALIEACAVGLPIIATAVGGNTEIVRDGINGSIVEAGDPVLLATAINDLLADTSRAMAMGRAGRDWVLHHGTVEAMASRYEAIYRTAVAQ
jgi:glycosyltransferase involved in cell wall biosynthesis